jgi:hypothetical protein
MRVFDVETNWVGQLKSFVPPLEQKDVRKEAKSLIYDDALSLGDAPASIRDNSLSSDVDWNFSFVASFNFLDKKTSPRLGFAGRRKAGLKAKAAVLR